MFGERAVVCPAIATKYLIHRRNTELTITESWETVLGSIELGSYVSGVELIINGLNKGFANFIKLKNLIKYGDEIGPFVNKTAAEIIDDVEFANSLKNVQYLPGPKLPQNIANTFENGLYTNRRLVSNERFYRYHAVNNRTGKKYSWFTNEKYPTEAVLREKLAIKTEWGVEIEYVSEFNVPAGTWVCEGRAAAQGVGYPGGGYQAVITNTPNTWIIRTDKAF
jgi:hypothetical protein